MVLKLISDIDIRSPAITTLLVWSQPTKLLEWSQCTVDLALRSATVVVVNLKDI